MKKLLALITLALMLAWTSVTPMYAQDTNTTETEMVADSNGAADMEEPAMEEEPEPEVEEAASSEEAAAESTDEEQGLHSAIKEKFIAGGAGFMAVVVICLILGLAVCIERILYLSMATTNTDQLLTDVEDALKSGGVDAAKEVCRNSRGPVASIFYQGLDRSSEGIEMVEKSIVSYGSVQMGLLEKGISWISLFIALAPMLGFFGTVIGMIEAFDAIAEANNISPAIVADGIGKALITTVSGLLVAMVLQVFYNFIVAKVDGLVNDMEDASISMVDILIKNNVTK